MDANKSRTRQTVERNLQRSQGDVCGMSPDLGKPPGLLLMKYAGRGEVMGDVRECEPVMAPSKFPAPGKRLISYRSILQESPNGSLHLVA